MIRENKENWGISITLILFFGLLLGTACSAMWFFGYMDFIRPMVPYVFVFGLIVLTITTIISVKFNKRPEYPEETFGSGSETEYESCHNKKCTCMSVRKYAKLIIASGGIVLVFAMTVMATYLSLIARYVIGLIGAVSFWVLLFSFLSMICCFFAGRNRS